MKSHTDDLKAVIEEPRIVDEVKKAGNDENEMTPETKAETNSIIKSSEKFEPHSKKISAIIDEWDTFGSTYDPLKRNEFKKSQLSAIVSLASIEDRENGSHFRSIDNKDIQSKQINEFCCTSIESFSNVKLSAKKESARKNYFKNARSNDENEESTNQLKSELRNAYSSNSGGEFGPKRNFRIREVQSGHGKLFSEIVVEDYESSRHLRKQSKLNKQPYGKATNDVEMIQEEFKKKDLGPVITNRNMQYKFL